MSNPVHTRRDGNVLIVTSDHPPVNALGAAVRQGLDKALSHAAADDSVATIVITCAGKTFFAGADITEFGKPMVDPLLPVLVDRIEALEKPVIAAVHGTALGGGCEVALACHYRIAAPSAKFGLPEVKLGILPGAGGTQRLPRVIGVEAALEMMTKGAPVTAAQAQSAGLVDRLAGEGKLLADAIAFAREIAAARPLPRASERAVDVDADAFAAFRNANARRFQRFEAPVEIIDVVEATAGKPYAEGVRREQQSFLKLVMSVQSAAQRHLFFAERKAARIEGLPDDARPRPVERVGIVGAGTMGGGIAMNFLSAGIPVRLVETQREALDRGVALIRRNYDATAARGRVTGEQGDRAMAMLTPTLALADLADCDLIVEAVYEDIAVKKDVFARLDAVAKPGAIIATNTSFLDVDEIAAATGRPQDVLGLHFFSPANVMKLLEVVRAERTAPDVLATAMAVAKRIRKVAVVAGVCHGFIGNRMLEPRQTQATRLLLEGATPEQIDRVHVAFGMPMGPFQMADLAGVDIGWHRDPTRIDSIRDALAAEGRWGQKKGAGFYDYDERRNPSPSARVAEIIDGFRKRLGVGPREVTDREIIERTLYPMVNEGARILEEGIAQRAGDIDVVWAYGYGWPAYRGGPMFWADTEGLPKIVEALQRHGIEVADLLRDNAASGERFC